MRSKFFASVAIACLLFSVVGLSADNRPKKAKKRQVNRLVTLLPASDGVAVLDSKRFFNDSLPKVLVANQPLMAEIMSKVTEIQYRAGIDLRKFDQAALGVRYRQISAKEVDHEPVIVASGDVDFGALVAVAKTASNGQFRSEMVGDKSVFVFTAKAPAQTTSSASTGSALSSIADTVTNGYSKEVALAAIDRNTVAVGTLSRVRETLEAKTRVAAELTALLPVRQSSVVTFAMRTHVGMAAFLPLDGDELAKNIESVQFLSGWADVAAARALVQLMARTQRVDQAEQLKDTLDVLRIMGKGLLGASKRADQKIYGRMLANARFTHRATDVTLDLTVPQADIDALIATIK